VTVPTFRLSARVASLDGAVPGVQAFTFSVSRFGANPPQDVGPRFTVTGAASSPAIVIGAQEVAVLMAAPPNAKLASDAGLTDFCVLQLIVGGAGRSTVVEGTIHLDEGQRDVPFSAELYGSRLGLVVYRQNGLAAAATFADYNQRALKAVEAAVGEPRALPRHFVFVGTFDAGDTDRRNWGTGLRALKLLGHNAVALQHKPELDLVTQTKLHRGLLAEAGISRTAVFLYNPPGYYFDYAGASPGDSPEPPTGKGIRRWAKRLRANLTRAGFAPNQMALIAISDEPGWLYPREIVGARRSKAARDEFRKYLRDLRFKPRDFGKRSWTQLSPVGRSRQFGPLTEKKLFYWSMRFYPHASAQHYKDCTAALESQFYKGLRVLTNWNWFAGRSFSPGTFTNPDAASPDSSAGTHDWLEFGRLRGGTALWTEDWFSDFFSFQWSNYASRLSSAANKAGVGFGGYVVPLTGGATSDGILKRTMALIGHGAKTISYYTFGPAYVRPGEGYSEKLVSTPAVAANMAEASGLTARAEDLLWPGRPLPNDVAILFPRSSQIWDPFGGQEITDATNFNIYAETVDYLAEVHGLYLALQHANVPVTWIDEEDLTAAVLGRYKLLYVTGPNIPAEGQRAIVSWVQSGGTLVSVPGAGARDRYNEALGRVASLGDLGEGQHERQAVRSIYALFPQWGVTDGGSKAQAVGGPELRTAVSPGGARVVASYVDDGAPAIVSAAAGAGTRVHFTFFPGMSYVRSGSSPPDPGREAGLPQGFSDVLRDWVVERPLVAAGVQRPVELGTPLVEAPVLRSSSGWAVTLLNWTPGPVSVLDVRARVPFSATRVDSARHGDVQFTPTRDGIVFDLPLEAVDVLRIYGPAARSAAPHVGPEGWGSVPI